VWQGDWSDSGGNVPPKAIYVPDGSVDAYKEAENWSEFADSIKPMSDLQFIIFTVNGIECRAKAGMTWAEWIDSEYYNASTNAVISTKTYNEDHPVISCYPDGGAPLRWDEFNVGMGTTDALPNDLIQETAYRDA
jgi:hypothetical protein